MFGYFSFWWATPPSAHSLWEALVTWPTMVV